MTKIIAVTKHHKNENWRNVILLEEDGKSVPAICFGKQADDLVLGTPLPEGWTIEAGQYGPVLRYPKPPGQAGGQRIQASWRNTEEGFRYEQARMDRRTALMQAVAAGVGPGDIVSLATTLYGWLRKEE